jgi:hypothetical protein
VSRKLRSGRNRILARACVLTTFAAILAFAVYPHRKMEQPQNAGELPQQLAMDLRTAAIFSQSCADCHSNRTRQPWYGYLPPASWLIKHDVDGARKHFNASAWSSYSVTQKRDILGDIVRVVANREMPLQQYLLLHRSARLSDRDREVLVKWAKGQWRLLRKMEVEASNVESLPEGAAR